MSDRKPELRLYSFVNNVYMSAIQHGIQTGHAAVDLVRAYTNPDEDIKIFSDPWYDRADDVEEWADDWKTFIILGAGDYQGVNEAYDILAATDLPYGDFVESPRANGGLRTCAVIVLPDYIFDAQFDQYETRKNSDQEIKDARAGLPTPEVMGKPIYSWGKAADDTKILYKSGDKYYDLIALLRRSRLA